jgi:hypothetical protein
VRNGYRLQDCGDIRRFDAIGDEKKRTGGGGAQSNGFAAKVISAPSAYRTE